MGTQHIVVKNVVASSTQADGINLHGKVEHALVDQVYFQNAGDDIYALWGAGLSPTDVVFRDAVAVNPGILRPNWYGNCVATYGLQSVVFENLTCRAPSLDHPILAPGSDELRIDTSMFVFFNSFGADYPSGNSVQIKGWTFQDLNEQPWFPNEGVMDKPEIGRMTWTKSADGVVAPYYVTSKDQQVNVYAQH